MKATTTIPIVGIDLENDPVANGWVRSLARPGGNFTGLFLDLPELGGKQIELLKEVVPRLSKPGALWDAAIGEAQFRATQTAAQAAGVTLHSLPIRGPDDFKDAFDRAARREASIHAVILLQTIPETIEALGDGLIREAGKGLRAGVDLNTGKDATGSKNRMTHGSFARLFNSA